MQIPQPIHVILQKPGIIVVYLSGIDPGPRYRSEKGDRMLILLSVYVCAFMGRVHSS